MSVHVDNDDFFLVAPRPLLPLRHALGRSLISLQGSRRIGHRPPLYQRILRLYWDAATPSTPTFLMLCICSLNCRGLKPPMYIGIYLDAAAPSTFTFTFNLFVVLDRLLCNKQILFAKIVVPDHSP